MTQLTFTSRMEDDHLVVTTSGYINHHGGEKIAEECFKYIDEGTTKVILDLKDSKVVNSIGISVLIEVIEKLNDVKGTLTFINLEPPIEKTFTIMGLFQYAKKADSLEAAMQ